MVNRALFGGVGGPSAGRAWSRPLVIVLLASLPLATQAQSPTAPQQVDYQKDVKPLLAENCYSCHGIEAQQAGLRLDLRQAALRGGDYGPVIIPGKSAESKLIKRLVDGDGGMQMPPTGPLTTEQIGVLRAWIDQGAEFSTEIAERPLPPVDPRLAAVISTAREGSPDALEKALRGSPELTKASDPGGSTLLHHAAGFGAVETMAWLLESGADVNARNRRRSTALHWAVHDTAKVRLLLSKGAEVNARQAEGRTPLHLASMLGNGNEILRMLLDAGGDPRIATANGQTPLMAAAIRGNVDAMTLLIGKGADVNARSGTGETALMFAATNGSPAAVRLLLERGADLTARSKRNETALGNAATAGVDETVRMLLEGGADVNTRNVRGYSPLMLAASSDAVPADVVKRLLARGADTTFTGDYDETARDLAAKRGHTDVTRLLGGAAAGGPEPAVSHTSSATRPIGAAVQTALTLLEKQSSTFIRTAGCDSCHSQDLPSAAAAFARSRGLSAPREIAQLPASMKNPPERVMDLAFVAVAGPAWDLFDFAMNGVPRSAYTDAVVRVIRAMQTAEGNWSSNEGRRPPMSAGDFQATSLAIFALKRYGRPVDERLTSETIARAAGWLERTIPATTQDRAFHALGLEWAGSADAAKKSARMLIATQRQDGGWSQMTTMGSDAYATGQALFALHEAGKMRAGDAVYRRGVDYLLRTQAGDGSWHVKSRSIWLQPYLESGFPYGQDQFISTAGTAWASLALAAAVEPPRPTRR